MPNHVAPGVSWDIEQVLGVGWEGRWGSTRVAQLGSIGQEEEAEIWLLLHGKAGKPLGTGSGTLKLPRQ